MQKPCNVQGATPARVRLSLVATGGTLPETWAAVVLRQGEATSPLAFADSTIEVTARDIIEEIYIWAREPY